jgi:hypothetical protein
MARVIGIRHRVKKTSQGEARPTQVVILEDGKVKTYDLENDDAELDFVRGKFPVKFRKFVPGDRPHELPARHVRWRKVKEEEVPLTLLESSRREGKVFFAATHVPAEYDGLQPGDTVAMCLGGSGNRLAFALSRRAEELGGGTKIMRLPPFVLKAKRTRDKDEDALTLAELGRDEPQLFQETTRRDRDLIRLIEAWRVRIDAMKARIACEQRLYQRMIGAIFCSEEGYYPEGEIERLFEAGKASDAILQVLLREEELREQALVKILKPIPAYQRIFEPLEGAGPMIAARLIVAIGDIRRFATDAKLKAFCSVHVLRDGRFARKRAGEVANWHPEARQALYLLADQFNRRPDSVWGKKLREYKARLRAAHPEVVVVDGKKRYTDGHIHKMALWRTVTKFVEWLFREWWKLERGDAVTQSADAA